MADLENYEFTEQDIKSILHYFEQHYGKHSYVMVADPDKEIKALTSRVGGVPYFMEHEDGDKYPKDLQDKPMRLLCLINLQEIAAAPESDKVNKFNLAALSLPKQGILQFLAGVDDSFGCSYGADNPNFKVLYYPEVPEQDLNLSMEQLKERLEVKGIDLDFASNLNDEENLDLYWPISGSIAVNFVPVVSLPCPGDFDEYSSALEAALQSVLKLEGFAKDKSDFIDLLDNLEDEHEIAEVLSNDRDLTQQERDFTVGWVGGYPDFTQDNPIPYDENLSKRFNTLLLCLNGSSSIGSKFDMMWGDCGIADFFIHADKLKEQDFSDVYYTWDCC